MILQFHQNFHHVQIEPDVLFKKTDLFDLAGHDRFMNAFLPEKTREFFQFTHLDPAEGIRDFFENRFGFLFNTANHNAITHPFCFFSNKNRKAPVPCNNAHGLHDNIS